ncbi:GMC oxidoreductase [Microthyrium microscopicum]|uniref:GMC oxidoreductase n=1 Tax=Microthyrium microscopicum TaxID=703497 RepID=A0A6A6UED7_9PEZI|nr:GMC oxidoreductase [Microthyrium microscopicum]
MAWNTILTAVSLGLGLVRTTQAQSTAFTDAKSGIQFQQVAKGGFTFGIALPEKPTGDFIGRLVGTGAKGWSGVSLGGPMAKSLMVIAWPNGKNVVASLRDSVGYQMPTPSANTTMSLRPIAAGTSADGTTWTYTFLCKGCIQTDTSTFKADDTTPNLGYGLTSTAVTKPSDPESAIPFHASGYGLFPIDLTKARSSKFATWAATAGAADKPAGATPPPKAPTTPAAVSNSTWDYIVVGTGPAGLITATRLAETGKSVLLVERGGPSTAATGGKNWVSWNKTLTYYDVPGTFIPMPFATLGEGFCTDTAGLSGCILGGGGTMNGMAFIRPPSWDFDTRWPTGWKSKDMAKPAARLYERNPGTTAPSKDGKWYDADIYDVLEQFFKSNGWNEADSMKTPDDKNHTYGRPALNIHNGMRGGPLVTYLPLVQKKDNFKLLLQSKVIRVTRNGSKMTGVEIENAKGTRELHNLKAGGSVVLSAGVMSTPRILWRSGIGLPEQINAVKTGRIPVQLPDEKDWIKSPVGMEVMDHSRYMLTFNVAKGVKAYSNFNMAFPAAEVKTQYQQGIGALTQSFMRMDIFKRVVTKAGQSVFYQAHCAVPLLDAGNQIEFTFLMTHGQTSKGQLSINAFGNTFFKTQPWLQTDHDKEAMTLALDDLFNMTRKEGSRLSYSAGKDSTAQTVLKTPVQQGVHFIGGAKMGPDDGTKGGTAVVDLKTKVYGTDNLYVTDASFHPDLPTGNTQAIIMIAAEEATARIIAQTKGK